MLRSKLLLLHILLLKSVGMLYFIYMSMINSETEIKHRENNEWNFESLLKN